MDDARQRVIVELEELGEKISKLVKFLHCEKILSISTEARYLLNDQLRTMIEYGNILRRRLEIWGKTDEELNGSKCSFC